MKYLKFKSLTVFSILLLSTALAFSAPINIPMGANAYLTTNPKGARISNEGVVKWSDPSTVISSWFRINKTGNLNLSIRAKALSKDAEIKVSFNNQTVPLILNSEEWTVYPVADNITISETGYFRIDIQGVKKTGEFFAEISDLIVDGSALEEKPNYVKDFSYYFGRRGPSVHLKYSFPDDKENIEYFYNELTVPEGDDVIGSYYMANGFGEGYFGMQANSETERRILFSVWSPHVTDNPKDIPEHLQIKKLRQGEGVHIGEFGNEGSGGQSYLKYPWKAGVTYKFLMQVHPDGKGNTIYTAYFFATDEKRWRLIASFLRPETDTWYRGAHSFLENFIPNQGYLTRKVLFGNQWAVTNKGKWVELTDAVFTYDATAHQQVRTDYTGGVIEGKSFFLQNCGFFNENTIFNSKFERVKENKKPKINFKQLQSLK